jgi:hypothetical protein
MWALDWSRRRCDRMMRASGAMKKGSAGTSVWDCSHPVRRAVRPASVLSTFGRVLATHHVLPSIAPPRAPRRPPLAPHNRCRTDHGRAAVLIDGLRDTLNALSKLLR